MNAKPIKITLNWSLPNDDYEAIFLEATNAIIPHLANTSSEKYGIYMITPDSGVHFSILLWKEALEHGAGFANPKHFPATLASYPASHLARTLNIKGPNITLVGGEDCIPALSFTIENDISSKCIDAALILYLCWNNYSQKRQIELKALVFNFVDEIFAFDETTFQKLLHQSLFE
jgi:hypothetical protein